MKPSSAFVSRLRTVRRSAALAAGLLLLLAACASGQTLPDVAFEPVATGFERPLGVVRDGVSERLYVLEKGGAIRIVEDGAVLAEPFLDIRDRVSTRSERGLLGLAFAPSTDGAPPAEVFVHYSDTDGDTVLLRAPLADDRPDLDAATVMLRQEQPYANHNGGQLTFGLDGMLYLGLGDGGSGGDPLRAGQDTSTLLGKLLRLDVSGSPYAIPEDNPFAQGGGQPEIWALGLRNPWRFSFDAPTGDLWIADVGQNRTEEVNRLADNRPAGADFGWSTLEGDRCFRQENCDRSGTVPPLATYDHDEGLGRSVTGGYVYRGSRIPELRGAYVFGDFVGGTVMTVRPEDPEVRVLARPNVAIASFGVDADGELLVVDYGGGRLLRIVPD
jgi:glucose/arabinose dehydrogenase